MNVYEYRDDRFYCEGVDLTALADRYGTPAYVYSATMIRQCFHAYQDALAGVPHRVCYAVKANSNLSVLALLAKEGAGFDIVSGGELYRVLQAGGDPARIVFSGVGKTDAEIRYALESKIHGFNCESEAELQSISRIATAMGVTARVAIRVNPDVDAQTYPYLTTGMRDHKFGIDIALAEDVYALAAALPGLAATSVSCHIGSQIMTADPFLAAADKVIALVARLRAQGFKIDTLDLGGGLGVPYQDGESAVPTAEFIAQLRAKIEGLGVTLMLEPGRSIIGAAGVLMSRVVLVKTNGAKTFVVIDAAMNDLIRPALYGAHHDIIPVAQIGGATIIADIVGPVCETGDFIALAREIPELRAGDLVAIKTAGAYGMTMASNYNSRGRAVELLVEGDKIHVARVRETWEELIRGETVYESIYEQPIHFIGKRISFF